MRRGISFTVSPTERARLTALIRDRNAAQKHVCRAEIIPAECNGVGTVEIMRQTGKSKTCVWRWQERFATEGVEGLFRIAFAILARISSHLTASTPQLHIGHRRELGRV